MKTLLTTAAAAAAITLAFGAPALAKKTAPDDGVYSLYNVDPTDHTVIQDICFSGGCQFGITDSFDRPCAILETAPKVKKDISTRDIYILDKRSKSSDPMMLSIYHRVDDASSGFDNFSVTKTKTLTLDINGGSKANCKMVENPISVYLGTDLSDHSVMVDKRKLTASQAQSGATTLLTVDSRGYITISSSAAGGFMLLDPTGSPVVTGGGGPSEVGDQTATIFN